MPDYLPVEFNDGPLVYVEVNMGDIWFEQAFLSPSPLIASF
jgi:hypothetical protein